MKSSLFHSLTFRLGLMVLVALIPAILVAMAVNQTFRQHLQDESVQQLQTQADQMAGHGREVLAGGRQTLNALTRLAAMQGLYTHPLSELLRGIVSPSPHFVVCSFFNAQGDLVASSMPVAKPFNVTDRAWFQGVAESLSCTQGEFVVSRSYNIPVIAQNCPVLDATGHLTGVMSLGIGFDWFQKLASSLDLPPDASISIVDAQGEIRALFPQLTAEDAKYIPILPAVMEQVRQGKTILQDLGQDGVQRIDAYSLLSAQPGRELYVRVGIPVKSILAPAEASARQYVFGLLAAAAISLLAAGALGKTILKQVAAILAATRHLGAGDLSFRIRSRATGELAEVAEALDIMAEALDTSTRELHQAEQKVLDILDQTPDGYFVSTAEGVYLEANPAKLRLLGYDTLKQLQEEVRDIERQIYVYPENRRELIDRLLVEGQVNGLEFELYRRDGTTFWASLSARAMFDEDGRYVGMRGFTRDITARKDMERELQRSNERFLRVLENQTDAIFVADAETDVLLFANKVVLDSMGQDILGKPCWSAMRGRLRPCRNCPRRELLDEHGEPLGVLTREVHDELAGTWSLVRVQALRWVDGRLARLEIITDITDIKRVQEDLRSTSGHLRSILENTPALITIRDRAGRFVLVSKHLEDIWGRPAGEAIGKTPEEVYPPDIAATARKEDMDILDSGLPLTRIADIPMPDGRIIHLLATKFPLLDENGAPDMVCTIATDITERVHLERELRTAKEAAEKASRAKTEFLAKMSHELRTPLNAVLGFSELAEMADSTEERNRSLASLRESGRTLLALVNDILDLSRVESGRISLERVPFDLLQTVQSTLEHLTLEAVRKGLRLSLDIAPDVPRYVSGDPARLRQIITNLTANAVKFTPKGSVSVSVELVGADSPPRGKSPSGALLGGVQLLLRVQDTGIGIPEEVRHLVFENFTQADSSTSRKYGGSGLGLAICRQLARFMGGDIWLASESGAGSTFFVTLPFARAEAPKEPQDQSPKPTRQIRPLHILLAEDTPANVVIAQAFLQRLGHSFRHARNGVEALELLRSEEFDLVLMDVEMPQMDGLEATRRLRAGEAGGKNRLAPVLAMTAHALDAYREQCAAAGMNGFVPKPVSFRDLSEILSGQGASLPRRTGAGADLLDLQTALDMLSGHRELFGEVLDAYLEDLPEKRQAIAQALREGDDIALRLAAHSLKSSSSSVGAGPASRAAATLEDAAKDGLSALLPGLCETLDSLLAATEEALRRARATFGKEPAQ